MQLNSQSEWSEFVWCFGWHRTPLSIAWFSEGSWSNGHTFSPHSPIIHAFLYRLVHITRKRTSSTPSSDSSFIFRATSFYPQGVMTSFSQHFFQRSAADKIILFPSWTVLLEEKEATPSPGSQRTTQRTCVIRGCFRSPSKCGSLFTRAMIDFHLHDAFAKLRGWIIDNFRMDDGTREESHVSEEISLHHCHGRNLFPRSPAVFPMWPWNFRQSCEPSANQKAAAEVPNGEWHLRLPYLWTFMNRHCFSVNQKTKFIVSSSTQDVPPVCRFMIP